MNGGLHDLIRSCALLRYGILRIRHESTLNSSLQRWTGDKEKLSVWRKTVDGNDELSTRVRASKRDATRCIF